MNKNLTLLRALVIAGLVAPSLASATDGYFSNGYGMKSNGMGGAAVAVALEPFGGAVNPGAMAFLGNEWQAGLAWFSPDRYASRSGSGTHSSRRERNIRGRTPSLVMRCAHTSWSATMWQPQPQKNRPKTTVASSARAKKMKPAFSLPTSSVYIASLGSTGLGNGIAVPHGKGGATPSHPSARELPATLLFLVA